MARQTETARAQVYLDGKQAEAAIDALKKKSKELGEQLDEAIKVGDTKEIKKIEKEIRAVNSATRSLKKETFDYEAVLKNINGSSYNELNKALRTVQNQMRKMKRTDAGYMGKVAQVKQLKSEIRNLNEDTRATTSLWGRFTNSINQNLGAITAIGATLTGVAFSVKGFISGLVGLDDSLANVMKTTGMARKEVRQLYSEFNSLNTRTSKSVLLEYAEEAGRLGKRSKADVLEFVEVANKIGTALGDDLGDAPEAIREVGKLVNIFGVGEQYSVGFGESMEKIGSAINEIAANSSAGAGYQIDFLKRLSGTAKQAKITADEILGYSSVLDQNGQAVEMSATAQGKLMIDMFTAPAKYAAIAKMELKDFSALLEKDANEAFLKFLEGINGNNQGFMQMASTLDNLGVDGSRAVQVLTTLAANTGNIRKEQELANKAMIEGVSLTNEYEIKNNNLAGSWEKIQKKIRGIFVNTELIEKFEGTITALATSMENGSFDRYLKWFKNITIAAVAYVAVQKTIFYWDKISLALSNAKRISMIAYTGKLKLLTTITKAQTTAQKASNAALKANVWGLVIAGVVLATQRLIEYNRESRAMVRFNSMVEKAYTDTNDKLESQSSELEKLADRYRELKKVTDPSELQQEELRGVIEKIAEIVPGATTAIDEYNTALDVNVRKALDYTRTQKKILSELSGKNATEWVGQLTQDALDLQLKQQEKQRGLKYDKAWGWGKNEELSASESKVLDSEIEAIKDRRKVIFDLLKNTGIEVGELRGEIGSSLSRGKVSSNDLVYAKSARLELLKSYDKYQAEIEAKELKKANQKKEKPNSDTEVVLQNFISLSDQIETATKNIKRLKKELADLQSGKTPSLDYAKDISTKKEELKKEEITLDVLTGVDASAPSTKNDTKDREKKIQDYATNIKKQIRLAEFDIEQERINAMVDSIDKSIAESNLNYDKLIYANEQREAEMVEKLRDVRELEHEGKDFDRSTVTAADLSADQQQQIQDYYDLAEAYRARAGKENMEKMLEEFKTYEQKRNDIIAEYEAKRTNLHDSDGNLRDGVEQGNVNELDIQEENALTAIDEQFAQRELTYQSWLAHISNMSLLQLESTLENAERELKALEKSGGSGNNLSVARAKVSTAKKAVSKANADISTSPDQRSEKEWKDLFEVLTETNREFERIGDTVGGTAGEIIKTAGSLMSSTIQIISGIQTVTKAATDGVQTAAVGAAAAIRTVETASVILTIISAALQIVTALFGLFKKDDYMAKFNAEMAELNYQLELVKLNSKIGDNKDTIFGADIWGAAKNNIEIANEALKKYNATLEATANRKIVGGIFGMALEAAGVKNQFDSLTDSIANMQLQTRHSTWFRSAEYTSLKSAVPELFGENGDVEMSALKEFLNDDAFDKLSQENQKYLTEMVDYWELYEEALSEVKDYLSDVFGDLGASMSDALVDAFKNGSDAAEAFSNTVSEMLEKLAQQMIYSVTLAPLLDQAQQAMLEAMSDTTLTDKERFAKFSDILSTLTDDVIEEQEYANSLYGEFKNIAAGKGVDIFSPDDLETQSAKGGGFETISEDTAGELNGRFTAMQASNEVIKLETIKIGVMMVEMKGIVLNIYCLVEEIRDYASYLPEIAERLKKIEKHFEEL